MRLGVSLRTAGFFCLAAGLCIVLANQGAAQTYYDTGGRVRSTDPFEDDGFKPVWQQQQEEKARQAAKAKQEAAKRAADEKAKGQQQAAAQTVPPLRTDTKTYERWTLTCDEWPGNKKTCAATLHVIEPQSGNLMVILDIRRGADGKLRSLIQTPTGVLLTTGVELKLGEGNLRKFVYESCTAQNCDAVGPADEVLIKELQAAPEAAFTVRAKDGRVVTFKSPLAGIEQAIAGVRS